MNIQDLPDDILQIIYKKSRTHTIVNLTDGIIYCWLFDTCKYFQKYKEPKEITFVYSYTNEYSRLT